MTRKQLPKAIVRASETLLGVGGNPVPPTTVPQSPSQYDSVEPEPALAAWSQPVANDQLPSASIHTQPHITRRRAEARKIVERHKTYAAVGGLFPLPIVNVAGVTAIIMRMVKQLSDLYGVPFERDRTRAAIIGLMGGAVPTGIGAVTSSTLVFAVPGSALFGLAVSAITAGALTRGIGLVFVEHFENTTIPFGPMEAKRA